MEESRFSPVSSALSPQAASPRIAASGLGEPHGDVAREVAVARIARALDRAFDRKIARGVRKIGETGEGGGYKFGDDAFHGAQLNQNNSIGSTSIDQRTLRPVGSCSSNGRNSRSTSCRIARSLD